jgi:predicted Zn-dependent protease
MTRREGCLLLVIVTVLLPAVAAAAWYRYGPAYRQARLLSEGESALADGRWGAAEAALQALLAEQPDQVHARYLYAQALRRRGKTSAAETALARAQQKGLGEAEARREQGLLLARRNFTEAAPVLGRVADDNPQDVEVHQALAEGFARNGQWAEADEAYTRWLKQEPHQVEALFERGQVRREAGRLGQALADYRAVLELAPNHYRARLMLADCLLSTGRLAEAEAALLVCRQLHPDSAAPLIGLSICALEEPDRDRSRLYRAELLLREALNLEPTSVPALKKQGDVQMIRGRYDLAVGLFEAVVRLEPRDRKGHLSLAQALRQTGNEERARQHAARYEELGREEEQTRSGRRGVP